MNSKITSKSLVLACVAVMLSAFAVADKTTSPAASTTATEQQPMKDAWIDTRLETAYLFNRHLNNFKIQSEVDNGTVLLTGVVRSEIDKDLAGEIAKSLGGVKSVNNQLIIKQTIDVPDQESEDRKFSRKVDDATTTALVKTKLIANQNLAGLAINVDTRNSVVTLMGKVNSAEEKQLAELIARNTPDVESVANELRVAASTRESG